MVGYYEQKQSRAAVWCLRLAIFAAPFLFATVYLHRTGNINTSHAFWLIAIGIAIIVCAILLGLRAATDIWEKGYRGGRKTVNGITLSALLLAPFGYQLVLAVENPRLNDVSTDVINPPNYLVTKDFVGYNSTYDAFDGQTILASYPEASPRQYSATSRRVYDAVDTIIKNWKWQRVESVNVPQPQSASEDEPELEGAPEDSRNNEVMESTLDAPILVQVKAKSFVLKLNADIIVKITPIEDSVSLVDVRSRSQWGQHDFGSNAKNIVKFLEELDGQLAGIAGETIQ